MPDPLQVRLQTLRNRLVDVSLRNRLLNFRDVGSQTLPFRPCNLAALYRALVSSERTLEVEGSSKSQADLEQLDENIPTQVSPKIRFDGEDATADLKDDVLRSRDTATKTDARMNALYRKYRECLEAFGSNLCFMVIGFLEWTDARRDEGDKLYAPLLLVPVSLDRLKRQLSLADASDNDLILDDDSAGTKRRGRTARSSTPNLITTAYRFTVSYDGEDISDNVALRLKLQSMPGGAILPEFDSEGEDVDLESYLRAVERMIERIPPEVCAGWKVVRGARLAFFSSAKEAMYRDLDPELWKKSGLVTKEWIKAALDGREADEEHHIDESELTDAMHVTPVPTVVPADSSQMKAIMRVVRRGQSLVIQGPPGTGKSQTITNLIAASLAAGKSVLFVAEKMAALSVVRERLEATGIGRYCLELHSAKATPRQVLAQVGHRLSHKPVGTVADAQHSSPLQRMNLHRNALGTYGRAINGTSSQIGVSFQEAVWQQSQAQTALEQGLVEGVSAAATLPALEMAVEPGHSELATLQDAVKIASRCIAEGVHLAAAPWIGTCPRTYPNQAIEQTIRSILINSLQLVDQLASNEKQMSEPTLWQDLTAAHWLSIKKGFRPSAPPPLPQLICERIAHDESAIGQYQLYVHSMRAWSAPLPDAAQALSEKSAIADSVITSAAVAVDRLDRALASRLNVETLAQLRAAVDQISWLNEALEQRALGLDEVAKLVKLPSSSEIFSDGTRLAHQAKDLSALSPSVWRAMSVSLLRPGAAIQLQAAIARGAGLQATRKLLSANVLIEALPDDAHWKDLSHQLRATSSGWFNWLPGTQGYKLRQQLRAYFSKPLRVEADATSMMDQALQWRRDVQAFGDDGDCKMLLGHAFVGMNSDWRSIDHALSFLTCWRDQFTLDATYALIEAKADVSEACVQIADLSHEVLKHEDGILDIAVRLLRREEATLRHLAHEAFASDVQIHANEAIVIWNDIEAIGLNPDTLTGEVPSLCRTALNLRGWKSEVANLVSDSNFVGSLHQGMVGTDVSVVDAAVVWIDDLMQTSVLSLPIKRWILADSPAIRTKEVIAGIESVCHCIAEFQRELAKLDEVVVIADKAAPLSSDHLARTHSVAKCDIESALASIEMIGPWFQLCESEAEIERAGGDQVWRWCRDGLLSDQMAQCAVQLAFWNRIVAEFIKRHPELQTYHRQKLEEHRVGFNALDKEVGERLRRAVDHAIYRPENTAAGGRRQGSTKEYTEMSLLRHEMPKKKGHVPVRRLLRQSATALKHLMPCWMMGPQAVAQFLEPEHIEFDLLIIDEASQVRPEDALGALARAKQIVIVGDSKQMPPTDVFRAIGASEDDEVEGENGEKIDVSGPALGLDSILDLYQAQLPSEMLRWHYRSLHQQLIAFSNEYFYDGALIVPPSRWHENPDLGIKRHFVENGRLQDRKNPAEAEQVVALIREHVLERSHESLGVVAMNSDQQSIIQDLWEEACKSDEVLEEAFSSFNEGTKLFIRNLENVQGDERDVIIISTNYAKNAAGEMFQRFGPINKAGGQRRLNVLFTRAKKRIHLVTSLVHTDIQPSMSASDTGRGYFRKYLQFAESGHLPDSGAGAIKKSPDSAFEVSVAQCINSLGFDLHYQVGVQGFFIDIGVLHPDGDRYLCGIECDGAAYHSHPIARDRDGIRQEILERRGWNIYRIWSTDWIRNRSLEINRLRNHLAQMVHRV